MQIIKLIIITFLTRSVFSINWIGKWEIFSANSTDEQICPTPFNQNIVVVEKIDDYLHISDQYQIDYKVYWKYNESITESCDRNWCYRGSLIDSNGTYLKARVERYQKNHGFLKKNICSFEMISSSDESINEQAKNTDSKSQISYTEEYYQYEDGYTATWLGHWKILDSYSSNVMRCQAPKSINNLEITYDGKWMKIRDSEYVNYSINWIPDVGTQYYRRGDWVFEGSMRIKDQKLIAFVYISNEETYDRLYCYWRMEKKIPIYDDYDNSNNY